MIKTIRTLAAGILLATSCIASLAAHAGDLETVKQKGELKFALTGKYPPFSFIDLDGKLQGFDVDIGDSLAQRIGVQPMPVTTAWDGIIGGLLAGKYDAIIGSLAITDERLKAVDFSEPYYQSGAQLFVRQDSPVRGIDEMDAKVIGITLGETYEGWLREHKPNVTLKTYKGLPDILLDLQNKRIDGFVTDKIAGLLTIRDRRLDARPAGELLYPEKMGIAVRKDSPELKAAINAALAEITANGTYSGISQKWLGTDIR
ncbi:ABC transporter substrate-binding protein [Pseudomonas sp. CR3202]|uniref:ABC transporter substrate-binding protein n=1 Tax=Pseudomonas sp. CR3202 TaxID=3351532 RepID=UPI003BF317B8